MRAAVRRGASRRAACAAWASPEGKRSFTVVVDRHRSTKPAESLVRNLKTRGYTSAGRALALQAATPIHCSSEASEQVKRIWPSPVSEKSSVLRIVLRDERPPAGAGLDQSLGPQPFQC